MQSTSWEMLDWKKHKLESRLPGEISKGAAIRSHGDAPLVQNTHWVSKQRRVWKNVKNLINNFIWLHLDKIIYWTLLLLFSHLVVSDSFATPWIGIIQARILEWVAISFLQGIFLTQGLNPRLLHCRQILYHWATSEDQYIGSFLSFSH